MSGCPEYVIWEHEVVSDESCMVQCFHNVRCESFQVFLFNGYRTCQLLEIDRRNKSLSANLYASKERTVFYYDQWGTLLPLQNPSDLTITPIKSNTPANIIYPTPSPYSSTTHHTTVSDTTTHTQRKLEAANKIATTFVPIVKEEEDSEKEGF